MQHAYATHTKLRWTVLIFSMTSCQYLVDVLLVFLSWYKNSDMNDSKERKNAI
jgi:hypothetical protein